MLGSSFGLNSTSDDFGSFPFKKHEFLLTPKKQHVRADCHRLKRWSLSGFGTPILGPMTSSLTNSSCMGS